MKTRQNVDFSKHDLIVKKEKGFSTYQLKKPGTIIFNIKFINNNGVMLVIGDVGNWVFCREFAPSIGGFVSDDYWLEKLTINSVQEGSEFNSEETEKEILQGINGELKEIGYEGDKLHEVVEYYSNLLDYVECSEWEYTAYAYNNFPSFLCAEDVPFVKVIKNRLQIVFDAFEEICNRLDFKDNTKINFHDLSESKNEDGIIFKDSSYAGGVKVKSKDGSFRAIEIIQNFKVYGK